MSVEECIEYLGYRIDQMIQLLLELNVPAVNGVMAVGGELQFNKNRLCRMSLPDHELKQVKRLWKVGIYDDTVASGISVFEGNTLHDALLNAVEYVKDLNK